MDLIRPILPGVDPSCLAHSCLISATKLKDPNLQPTLPVEERFGFFSQHISQAKIWDDHDGALFKRFQVLANNLMEEIAVLCDDRYELV